MKAITHLMLAIIIGSLVYNVRAGTLESNFKHPPEQTKPWCYWYWISDNISKEGITRDLEAMARVGIGEALIGNIHQDAVPAGKIKVLSPEWWALVEHAIREGGRVGVNIGMFNCPGWSQSGGPWIKPAETMRYLATSETRMSGPQKFSGKLPTRIRSNGMSIALLVNQAVSTTIAAVFLPSVGKHGYATMFFIFAGCTVVYFITAAFFLPETKGKTLEEIEAHFEGKGPGNRTL